MSEMMPGSALARLEVQLRSHRALGKLAQSHVHRAVREDSLGFTIGRDAILADWVTKDRASVTMLADLGDMVACDVKADTQSWQSHRWVVREGTKIIRETLIENCQTPKSAGPVHPPLGELRAGRGQFDAGINPVLPADFPKTAEPLASLLHQAWNGRAFDLYDAPWLVALMRTLPDATFYFERAIVKGDQYALLWRLHGHHREGHRIRLIGSSVITFVGEAITSDKTIVDFSAMEAQLARHLISYG